MTLYDHLGPNENIRPALCEGGEDFFMSPFFAVVSASILKITGLWKFPLCKFFQFLGPRPKGRDKRGTAGRTLDPAAAVQIRSSGILTVRFVVCKTHITVWAFHRLSAGAAGHKAAISPPVHEQHHLLPVRQPVLDQPF